MAKKKFVRPHKGLKRLKRRRAQKWRKPGIGDNKIRRKERGKPKPVEIGYRKAKNERGKIEGKTPVVVKNEKELLAIKQDEIAIIGKVGKKKKLRLVKLAAENKIPVANVNVKKFLKELEQKKKAKAEKDKKEEKVKKEKVSEKQAKKVETKEEKLEGGKKKK